MLVNTQITAWQPWVTPSPLLPICNTHLGQGRKRLSFLTPSPPFPSSLLVFFPPHLQLQCACQGRWQVKSLPDYCNGRVKSNWIHVPWMAIYSQCWPSTLMRGRWGRQGSDKAGADKEGQGGVLVPLLRLRCLIPGLQSEPWLGKLGAVHWGTKELLIVVPSIFSSDSRSLSAFYLPETSTNIREERWGNVSV